MNKNNLDLATTVATASVTPKGDILMDLDENNNAIIHRPCACEQWVCALSYNHKTGEWGQGIYCKTIYDAVVERQKFTPEEVALPLAVQRFERPEGRGRATMWCSTTLDTDYLVFDLKLDFQDQLVITFNELTPLNLQKKAALEEVRERAIAASIDCSFLTDCKNGDFVYAPAKSFLYLHCESCGDMFPHEDCEGIEEQLCQCCQPPKEFKVKIVEAQPSFCTVLAHTEEEAKVLALRMLGQGKVEYSLIEIKTEVEEVE